MKRETTEIFRKFDEARMKESEVGGQLYKGLGKLIETAKKGTKDLGLDEKQDIKGRCKELSALIK